MKGEFMVVVLDYEKHKPGFQLIGFGLVVPAISPNCLPHFPPCAVCYPVEETRLRQHERSSTMVLPCVPELTFLAGRVDECRLLWAKWLLGCRLVSTVAFFVIRKQVIMAWVQTCTVLVPGAGILCDSGRQAKEVAAGVHMRPQEPSACAHRRRRGQPAFRA